MNVCCCCSAGGHLTELLQLEEAWQGFEHFYLTDKRLDSRKLAEREKVYFAVCPRRNPLKLLVNFVQSFIVFLKERPQAVVSTGADTAIPFCLIARLFGRKVVFIESFCRVQQLSLSGEIMLNKADLFIVQWKQLLKATKGRGEYAGSVF